MSCGHCVNALTKKLQALEELSVESVGIGTATVKIDDNLSADSVHVMLAKVVKEAGFTLGGLN